VWGCSGICAWLKDEEEDGGVRAGGRRGVVLLHMVLCM
jgi:hypothetical protein